MTDVTVLITVYNGEKYLHSTVKSLLNQTFQDFEVLIVDDCSTDKSLEIIRSFDDKRLRIYSNEVNIGQTKSLNVGLSLAKGRHVARMDADDFAFPQWLEQQHAFIQNHPDNIAVSARAVVIDADDNIKKILNTPLDHEHIFLKALISSPINHVGTLMNKDIVLKVGGYDENLKVAADYALWSKLLLHHYKLSTNPYIGVAVRHHEQSVSQVEHNDVGLAEISQVIYHNISNFTNYEILIEEVDLLRDYIYNTKTITSKEVAENTRRLGRIYSLIKEEYNIPNCLINDFVKENIRILRLKNTLAVCKQSSFLKIIPFIFDKMRFLKATNCIKGKRLNEHYSY